MGYIITVFIAEHPTILQEKSKSTGFIQIIRIFEELNFRIYTFENSRWITKDYEKVKSSDLIFVYIPALKLMQAHCIGYAHAVGVPILGYNPANISLNAEMFPAFQYIATEKAELSEVLLNFKKSGGFVKND